MRIKQIAKKILGIYPARSLTLRGFIQSWHRRLGPFFYRKKYSIDDVVAAMKRAGMKRGSTIMIQSAWGELYNCTGTANELIERIIEEIGEEGTLCMSCLPKIKRGEKLDINNTPTKAGYLAECFRKYPGVKRSIHNVQSVCAIGANADYLLSEHHQGETPFDEKSPFFKLSKVNALIFGIGLGHNWIGTIAHCPESLLRDKLPYYRDLWNKEKTEFFYIDADGKQKSYYNFDMPQSGRKKRISGYFQYMRVIKYLHPRNQQVSNLKISCFDAAEVVLVMTDLARRGINICLWPLAIGYDFEKISTDRTGDLLGTGSIDVQKNGLNNNPSK